MTSNLLAVDFDSFFPNPWGDPEATGNRMWCFDWGHKEAPLFQEIIWHTRAENFLLNGFELPDLDQRWINFWHRFEFTRGAKLYFADSNACAVNPTITGRQRHWGEVWLYDAHHDSGYRSSVGENWLDLVQRGEFSCENWMVLYSVMGADLHMRYPEWRAWALDPERGEPTPTVPVDRAVDDGTAPDIRFDRVFVCRSSAWVPSWLGIDQRFEEFVANCPVKTKTDVQPGGTHRRVLDMDAVQRGMDIYLRQKAEIAAQGGHLL